MKDTNVNRLKNYEELEFKDDFMFGKVMENKALCREVLECLLQYPIGELTDIQSQREFRYTQDGKKIRLDIYTRDENTIYDAEMQNRDHKTLESLELPKRTRYYQSLLDMDHIEKAQSYRWLPNSEIIFICTFDPFEEGLPFYSFKNICHENNKIHLEDGTSKRFFNCTYKGLDINENLRRFYNYVMTGKAEGRLTKRLNREVIKARNNEKWRSEFMKEQVLLMDIREEGIKEGISRERENTLKMKEKLDKAEDYIKELEEKLSAFNKQ